MFCFKLGIWLPWSATKGKYVKGGVTIVQSSANNLQDCMSRCFRNSANGKECRSLTITTNSAKTCDLRTARIGDEWVASRRSIAWQSFNRPTWYLGKKNMINTLSHRLSAFFMPLPALSNLKFIWPTRKWQQTIIYQKIFSVYGWLY